MQNLHSIKIFLIIFSLILTATQVLAQSKEQSMTIENYYKVKWGYAKEFIGLWKANHYPLLKKAQERGDIISVTAEKPNMHSGEDTRWDFKVTIVFKNPDKAFDAHLTDPYKKLIYPNTNQLKNDQQQQFALLIAH